MLLAWSWRRQLLSCVLIASKVLDDQAVWNVDYCQFLTDIDVEDLNLLERHTLRLLQFNINVPAAVYARYFFDLMAVGQRAGVANRLIDRKRLTPSLAIRLRLTSVLPRPIPSCLPAPLSSLTSAASIAPTSCSSPFPPSLIRSCTESSQLGDWLSGLLFDLPNYYYTPDVTKPELRQSLITRPAKVYALNVVSHTNDTLPPTVLAPTRRDWPVSVSTSKGLELPGGVLYLNNLEKPPSSVITRTLPFSAVCGKDHCRHAEAEQHSYQHHQRPSNSSNHNPLDRAKVVPESALTSSDLAHLLERGKRSSACLALRNRENRSGWIWRTRASPDETYDEGTGEDEDEDDVGDAEKAEEDYDSGEDETDEADEGTADFRDRDWLSPPSPWTVSQSHTRVTQPLHHMYRLAEQVALTAGSGVEGTDLGIVFGGGSGGSSGGCGSGIGRPRSIGCGTGTTTDTDSGFVL
ncbi:unnamed protein product [Protopolystoma xenopodis]|uniref:Cyclin N-terminal domain-containing protein n=1 Tax=Protopolystoma xenopodis TaxID=117903 RepID=A0A448WGF6_9PLAT|nr:unnamed protein product [Protopolystoma xenopodis]